jgi:hypothetical protein
LGTKRGARKRISLRLNLRGGGRLGLTGSESRNVELQREEAGAADRAHHHCNLRGLAALSAISVQAAPLPPEKARPTKLAISPPVELAADGRGYGSRRARWQDQLGPLASGPLRSEDVGKSTSPPIFALGKASISDWGMPRLLLSPVHLGRDTFNRERYASCSFGGRAYRSSTGELIAGSPSPNLSRRSSA